MKLVVYPRQKGFLEALLQRNEADNSDKEAVGLALARVLQDVQPAARELKALGVAAKKDQEDVLKMPEMEVGR